MKVCREAGALDSISDYPGIIPSGSSTNPGTGSPGAEFRTGSLSNPGRLQGQFAGNKGPVRIGNPPGSADAQSFQTHGHETESGADRIRHPFLCLLILMATIAVTGEPIKVEFEAPTADRWMYAYNATPENVPRRPCSSPSPSPGIPTRVAQFLMGWGDLFPDHPGAAALGIGSVGASRSPRCGTGASCTIRRRTPLRPRCPPPIRGPFPMPTADARSNSMAPDSGRIHRRHLPGEFPVWIHRPRRP